MRLATVLNPRVSVHCTCLRVWICESVARIWAVGEAESDTVKQFCVMQEFMLVYVRRSVCVCVWKRHAKVPCCVGLQTSWWKFHITSSAQHGWNREKEQIKHKRALNMRELIYIWNKKWAKLEYEKHENVSPESSLVFQQRLQSHQPLFSLRPVGRGTSIEHFGHVLSLPHVRGNAAVPGAVRALRTRAGGVAICIIVRVHPIGVVPPPGWFLLLRKM